MKRHQVILAATMLLSAIAFQSCLDYDTTGDEFNSTTKDTQQVTNRGKVDSIPYKSVYTVEQVQTVAQKLEDPMRVALGAQFAMRGGKQGQTPVTHAYQYQFSLGVDNYAQYCAIPHTNFPYSKINIASTYAIDTKAYGGAMGSFKEVSTAAVPLMNHPSVDTIPELKAIYLLLYDYSAVEVADIYGPFPYNDLKTNKQTGPYDYDDVRSIYMRVVENIDTITACLKYLTTKPVEYQNAVNSILDRNLLLLSTGPGIGDPHIDTWIRFANSLKLRMAMHIVKVDKDLARRWAEAAVAGGVIETESQQMGLYPLVLGFTNPISGVYEWQDTRLAASFESVLKSLKHPYIDYLFAKNDNPFKNVKTNKITPKDSLVIGMRSGSHPGEGQDYASNQYIAFSKINSKYTALAPLYVMKLSEVCFLRAEGAVRGWNMGGDAKQFYEQGIRAGSIEDVNSKIKDYDDGTGNLKNHYDAMIDSYMQLEHAVPYTYNDPTGNTESIESAIKIGVKWNDSDSPEVKLEKIITQKYIAGFPYSFEAWVDLRRTGYPRLFDVLNVDDSDGSLKQGDIIRRLPFPDTQDGSVLQDVERTGLKGLNGPDVVGTRLWWDVNTSNF